MADKRTITELAPKRISYVTSQRIKACAYVRVSTEHAAQINSLKNQTEYYEKRLNQNPRFKNCGIYSDVGISGQREERPGFTAMLKKAKAGELDLILTKSISRFARNTVLLLQVVRELKEAGVAIVFEEQNINTLSSEGELLLTVLGAIAEEERKNVCQNSRWANQSRFKRGDVKVDTSRLLGYGRDDDGQLIIHEEQANIVRMIYRRYLAGASAYQIAREFNESGIPSHTKTPWSSHRILRIISNEKYKGDCLLQKTYMTEQGKQIKNTGQLAQYYLENHHPAIIRDGEWDAAQRLREGHKKKTYPFSSMIICPYCGAVLIRVIHEKKWVSWICGTYLHEGKAACRGARIPEKVLEELTKDTQVKELMILEEVHHGQDRKKKSAQDYRLVPAARSNIGRR